MTGTYEKGGAVAHVSLPSIEAGGEGGSATHIERLDTPSYAPPARVTARNPLLTKSRAVAHGCATGCATNNNPPVAPIDRHRSRLELWLLTWANLNWPDDGKQHPVDAIFGRWGDWEFERKCIGAIFRRICRIDPTWLVRIAIAEPEEVIAIGPWVKQVEMEWGPVPGRLTWREWVEAAWITFDDRVRHEPPAPTFRPAAAEVLRPSTAARRSRVAAPDAKSGSALWDDGTGMGSGEINATGVNAIK
jgi:hypothetical protein